MTAADYAKKHKDAFRCAFDFLNSHFPPGEDPEWWDQAAKDVSATSVTVGEEPLAVELLAAVYEYLDVIWKQRREKVG